MKGNTVIRQKRYAMPLQQKEILDKYCDELLKSGVSERSQGPYNNNILLVRKRSFDEADPTNLKNWTLVRDYRLLKSEMADPPMTSPDLVDIKKSVGRSRSSRFSTFDFLYGYHQVGLQPSPPFLRDQNP